MRISATEAAVRYGPIIGKVWLGETKWCVLVEIPEEIAATWINSATGEATRHIYLNREMAPALEAAIALVQARGLVSELKTFDGCFMIRGVRGETERLSCHAYACAIDINASTNVLGTDGDLTPELAQCFIDAGFTWGKMFTRKDPMHFSYAWE